MHFEYVSNSSLNAVAFSTSGTHFVGLYAGTVLLIHAMYMRILADPRLITHVGNASAEVQPSQFFRPDITDARELFDAGAKGGGPILDLAPRDLTRKVYARILATCAVEFLINHEFAHLLNGHVDWQAAEKGKCVIAELVPILEEERGLRSQTLEMDADCFAVSQGIFSCVNRAKNPETMNAEWRKHFMTLELGVDTWLFAIVLLFRLFGLSSVGSNSVRLFSHAPPHYRQFMVYTTAREALLKFAGEKAADRMQPDVEKRAEEAYAMVADQAPNFDGLREAVGSKALAHMADLLEEWKSLRPELLAFASIPLVV